MRIHASLSVRSFVARRFADWIFGISCVLHSKKWRTFRVSAIAITHLYTAHSGTRALHIRTETHKRNWVPECFGHTHMKMNVAVEFSLFFPCTHLYSMEYELFPCQYRLCGMWYRYWYTQYTNSIRNNYIFSAKTVFFIHISCAEMNFLVWCFKLTKKFTHVYTAPAHWLWARTTMRIRAHAHTYRM